MGDFFVDNEKLIFFFLQIPALLRGGNWKFCEYFGNCHSAAECYRLCLESMIVGLAIVSYVSSSDILLSPSQCRESLVPEHLLLSTLV